MVGYILSTYWSYPRLNALLKECKIKEAINLHVKLISAFIMIVVKMIYIKSKVENRVSGVRRKKEKKAKALYIGEERCNFKPS